MTSPHPLLPSTDAPASTARAGDTPSADDCVNLHELAAVEQMGRHHAWERPPLPPRFALLTLAVALVLVLGLGLAVGAAA